MKLFLVLFGLVVTAIVAPFLLPAPEGAADETALPWQIEVLPGGASKALGLTLPNSTLDEARARFGPEVEFGLLEDRQGKLSFEVYFPAVRLGFITGKLILTVAAPFDELEALARRATDSKALPSGARKHGIAPHDLTTTGAWPIRAMTFIPSANLSENTVLERFGPPSERLRASDSAEHLLYPEKGLDLLLDSEGKEVLQYVAPAAFEPLRALLGAPPAGQ